jgi:hypothetical protein
VPVVAPPYSDDETDTVHDSALEDATLAAGFGRPATYRPRRPSNIPSRRRRPRTAALSRSSRTLGWTSGRERAASGLAPAADAGLALGGPIVPTGATPEDTSSTPTMATVTATPGDLIC